LNYFQCQGDFIALGRIRIRFFFRGRIRIRIRSKWTGSGQNGPDPPTLTVHIRYRVLGVLHTATVCLDASTVHGYRVRRIGTDTDCQIVPRVSLKIQLQVATVSNFKILDMYYRVLDTVETLLVVQNIPPPPHFVWL
jgi:hypothetical protein